MLAKSRKSFLDEMTRCELLGLKMLNFHPGAHMNLHSPEDAWSWSPNPLILFDKTKGVTAVIENTAGQGSAVGTGLSTWVPLSRSFRIKKRVGVCLDTCHTSRLVMILNWRRLQSNPEGVWYYCWNFIPERAASERFQKRLWNTCRPTWKPEERGNGERVFRRIMNDSWFDNMPLILETPDESLWEEEIKWLYQLVQWCHSAVVQWCSGAVVMLRLFFVG